MADSTLTVAVVTATGVLGAAALSGFVSYRVTRWNIRRDLEVELRRQRLDAFKKLWAISQPLAKYGRSEAITVGAIIRLSQELRKWYFEDGGMFLTDDSRDAYLDFQESLQNVIKSHGDNKETELDDETFESLRRKGSSVRTTLRSSFGGFPQM